MTQIFEKVADLADLPEGELLGVEIDAHKLVLANVGGVIHALDGICSHMQGVLAEGSLFEGCLMCPVHGGEFDVRTGEAITSPAIDPLVSHEVRVEAGEIFVAKPD